MAEIFFHVDIIFLIIVGCIGPRCMGIRWTQSLGERLLDIFYGTYPDDERHLERVKREWDRQVPGYNGVGLDELTERVHKLQYRHWKQWLEHPADEREVLENCFVSLYDFVQKNPQDQEKHMLDMFLSQCPEYAREARMMRTIVYRWHELYIPLGKEIHAKDVDWTPKREAFLQNIYNQPEDRMRNKTRILKELWVAEYGHLNVDEGSLLRHAYYIKERDERESAKRELRQGMQGNGSQLASDENTTQEEGCDPKGRKSTWDPQMKADILCIINKIDGLEVKLAAAMKDRWVRMQRNYSHLSGPRLLAQARHLQVLKHKPKLNLIMEAEKKYARLPPLPQEVFSERGGRRKYQQLRIPGRHQGEPVSPSMEVTPELLMMSEHGVVGKNASYSEHAHHPHQIDYHGSSRHNSIDQRQFASLPDTPHPHHQFWNPVGSSGHTPIHGDPLESLANIQHSHQDFWGPGGSSSHIPIQSESFGSRTNVPYSHQDFWGLGGSSSHIPIQSDPFDSLPRTPYPHPDSWSSGGSSSYTPIHHDPSGALPNIPNPHEHFSSPSGSRSYTPILEDPSGLTVVAPRPQHHLRDPRGSSSRTSTHEGPSGSIAETSGQRRRRQPDHHEGRSHTSIHEDPSGLITVGPRPRHLQRDHHGRSNRTSVPEDLSHQQADTPRPYQHQFFPGSGSRHRLHPPQ